MANSKDTDQTGIRDLLGYVWQETAGSRLRCVAASTIAGLSRGGLLMIINAAAAAGGRLSLGLVAGFVAVLIVHLATGFLSVFLSDKLVRDLTQRLRLRICDKFLAAPLRLVEAQDPGKIFAQLGWEVDILARASANFLSALQSAVLLVFALGYLAWLSLPGVGIAALTILLSAAAYYWHENMAKETFRQAREKEIEFFDSMYDLMHGFKEVKLGRALQQDISRHVKISSEEFRVLSTKAVKLYRISDATSQAFTFCLIGMLVFVLPVMFPSGATSIFQLLTTILFVLGPAEQLISSIPTFSQATVALQLIKRLQKALHVDIVPTSSGGATPAFERIALSNVHFEFRGATAEESFDLGPIDLEIHQGETILICGGNGAGKTTLLKLITGLYHPSSGSIFLDGKPVTDANYEHYRELFAVVFSDVHLLRRLYGIAAPDPDQVQALLTRLQIDSKTRLEDGRFTATNLSTGQRKRLAYAISRLRDRQIYVFDEFAADQDPAFRSFFYTELLPELKRQGKTIIAITHDDRWFGAGDRLIKLEYGVIVAVEDHVPS